MFRRSLSVKLAFSTTVMIACLGAIPAYAEISFVTAGDDDGLQDALNKAAFSGCFTIVINQPTPDSGIPYAPFTRQVILGPSHSGLKIMAAPGEVAVFEAGIAFAINGATDVVLENLVITGGGIGVLVETEGSVKIINCQITCNELGISVIEEAMAEIEGSRILNNSKFGVVVAGSVATIEKTQIRNNGVGVSLTGPRGRAKIWHSMIDHNKEDGIRVASSSLAVLNNNDISFNGRNGVVFEKGSSGSMSFNTVTFNGATGILNQAGAANFNATPGNNTIAGNTPNTVGVPMAKNQIGPF